MNERITFRTPGTLGETETGVVVETLYRPNSGVLRAYVVRTENNPAVIVGKNQVIEITTQGEREET